MGRLSVYSAFENGDAFLLIMPLIFAAATVTIYLISSSCERGALSGAGTMLSANSWLAYRYPI
jgi:hypothetical protein